MTIPTCAVVMAAGRGDRLRPLTDLVPKPMLPIGGTAAIITLLQQLAELGVRDVWIVVGYRGDLLRRFVESTPVQHVTLHWVPQDPLRGSGDALQQALQAGLPHVASIVCAADTVWSTAALRSLLAASDERQATVAMGLRRYERVALPHGLCVSVSDDHVVTRVLDTPRADLDHAFGGSPFYVVEGRFWRRIAALDSSVSVIELASAIQFAIDDGERVIGIDLGDPLDLTSPRDLLETNFPYLSQWLAED